MGKEREIEVYVVHPNQDMCGQIAKSFNELNDPDIAVITESDLRRAQNEIVEQGAHIMVVLVDTVNDPQFRLVEHVSRATTGKTGIIVVSKDASQELLLQCMRAGAEEFINFPIDTKALGAALERVLRKKGFRTKRAGQIISVFSAKGGTGTTLLATNLAMNLAAESQQPNFSLLIDLNPYFGDAAVFTDTTRAPGTLADAARDAERLDSTMLMGYTAAHKSGCQVLIAPREPEDIEVITPDALGVVFRKCRETFAFTVADVAHIIDDRTVVALDVSDSILILCDMLVPTIRNTQQALELFRRLEYKADKMKVVINRFYKSDTVGLKEISKVLNMPVYWVIPYDTQTAVKAIDGGTALTVVNEGSGLTNSILTLSQHLGGLPIRESQSKKKFSLFGG
ncbi:MAG TPA: hypothetical protein PL033_03590 [Candidatus Brocadiia bacterium]|nr:hypothetical protein [Candidatus Brocadiia bacterium]